RLSVQGHRSKAMRVSDAVVEEACRAYYGESWLAMTEPMKQGPRRWMRNALEATWPKVLGEPVAYARVRDKTNPHFRDVVLPDSQEAEMWAYDLIPLYTLTNLEGTP